MAYVITEPCVGTCDGACTDVCPVDCIHGPVSLDELARTSKEARIEAVKGQQLYINPEECIHCGACAPECPVQAIYDEDELPEKWESYRQLNTEYFNS
ncbi:MAG: ferredoxin family protein [Myxococcales bacterium]|nr:ferredoxin family protein [Myxococcales bacterium]